jgi:hypothetical protein
MKYAMAISPDIMKAAGRVKRPTSSSRLPTISMTPAKPSNENNCRLSKLAT